MDKMAIRVKKKTGIKTKTGNKIQKVKERITKEKKRNQITVDSEEFKHYKIGKPRIFEKPSDLEDMFNSYIASCLEKVRKYQIVPTKTVEIGAKHVKLENVESDELTVEEEITEGKASKKKAGIQEITNQLESRYEIEETIRRKQTPTIGGFLRFCGGLAYSTFERYGEKEEFRGTVEGIRNYLESILVEQSSKGEFNPAIAQFVLNTVYNRVPKSKNENINKSEPLDVNDFIRD